MTATERLRAMLDERGVEWEKGKLATLDEEWTRWWESDPMDGFVAYECDYPLNTLTVRGITPEQAVAATLGRSAWDDGYLGELSRMRLEVELLRSENAKLRELIRDVVLLAGIAGCDVAGMQIHVHGGDWRTVWERMSELGVPGTEVEP